MLSFNNCLYTFLIFASLLLVSISEAGDVDITNKKKYNLRTPPTTVAYNLPVTIKRSLDTGILVHETYTENIFNGFIADILYLLPLDLVTVLAGDRHKLESFVGKCKFSPKHDYWRRLAGTDFTREGFEVRLIPLVSRISSFDKLELSILNKNTYRYSEIELASDIAATLPLIIEYTHVYPNDVTGEFTSFRMNQFYGSRNESYIIAYGGYNNATVPEVLDKLEIVRNKAEIDNSYYPDMVAATAELWTAIWQSSVDRVIKTPKQMFVVETKEMVFRPNLDIEAKIKDYTELAIIGNRDIRFPTAHIVQLMEKRTDDYVKASVAFDKQRSLSLNNNVPIYVGESLFNSIKFQQEYFNKLGS